MKIEREYWNTNHIAIFACACLIMIAVLLLGYSTHQTGPHDKRMAEDNQKKDSESVVQSNCTETETEANGYHVVACTSKTDNTDRNPL